MEVPVQSFEIHVEEPVLEDLHRRLRAGPTLLPGRPGARGPDARIGHDNLLTTITLHWATGSITSSMRDYVDNRWHGGSIGPDDRVRVPTAMAVFANEFVPEGEPPRALLERLYEIHRGTVSSRGGRFAAAEEPDLLAADIRAHFTTSQPRPPIS
jgi:hypothetical protein